MISLETLNLTAGVHLSPEEGLNVIEAAAYFAGEPHSNSPASVCPVLTKYLLSINDSMNDNERSRLKAYVLPLNGSKNDSYLKRLELLVMCNIKEVTPLMLRATGINNNIELATVLEATQENDFSSARETCYNAGDYNSYAASTYVINASSENSPVDSDNVISAITYAASVVTLAVISADSNTRDQIWTIVLNAIDRALEV
jgi:hypothetical protein